MIRVKRVYDEVSLDDGFRILIDRLWPRGVTKEKAKLDFWLKDIAPSEELRKWFSHDPNKWQEFKIRYFLQLKDNPSAVKFVKDKIRESNVSLIYGAKDDRYNNAVALKEYLES